MLQETLHKHTKEDRYAIAPFHPFNPKFMKWLLEALEADTSIFANRDVSKKS